MGEYYQMVAFIGLRNPDGSYLTNVPLYVKVSEVNVNGLTDMQEELIHRISDIMLHRYHQQLGDFIQQKKEEKAKNVVENKNIKKEEN